MRTQPLVAACHGASRRSLLELLALSYFEKGLANKVLEGLGEGARPAGFRSDRWSGFV